MKKHSVTCPVCGLRFDPRAPLVHINRYHQSATRSELVLIRDARRCCFGKSKPHKNKSPLLTLSHH
ncbi:putative Zn-finger protein [Pantoea dispersa]|nr:putative Zn-finger protein [Pantoea dispersa]